MRKHTAAVLVVASSMLTAVVHAEMEVGPAIDRELGAAFQFNNKINAFVGTGGVSADYLLLGGPLTEELKPKFNWYFGVGGFIDWKDKWGARAPAGIEWDFAKRWQGYGQVAAELRADDGLDLGIGLGIGARYLL